MSEFKTVVDYDAWGKGYMPPSEHILIDQLSYRGARVVMSSDFGKHGAIWVVTRDIQNLAPAARKALRELVHDIIDEQLGPDPVTPSTVEIIEPATNEK